MIKNLIKYQKLDKELISLQKVKDKEEANSQKEKLLKYRKDRQNKLLKLNEEAEKDLENLGKSVEITKKGIALADKLTGNKLEGMSVEELKDLLNRCNKATSDFDKITNKLKSVDKSISTKLEDFEKTKKEIIKSGKAIQELTENEKQTKEDNKSKIEEIVKQMEELEKEIPEDSLKKYKEIRQNKVFPVITKLVDKSCGSCGMMLSGKNLEELDSKGYTSCETCHRIVVKVQKEK